MAPKKAAVKSADKKSGKDKVASSEKDARRTFEHLGRVQILMRLATNEKNALDLLTNTADAAYRAKQYEDSANLLRAAEHICFATIHADATETVSADLKQVITKEIEHLNKRSEEETAKHALSSELKPLVERLRAEVTAAMKRGSYRAALEFARGTEALSHVHALDKKAIASGSASSSKQLRA